MPVKDDWVDGEQVTAADMNAVADAVNANESALGGKAPASHTHDASDINAGQLDIARIPVGTSSSTVAAGNDPRLSNQRTPTDNSVSTAKIQDNAVTTAKIQNGAVTAAKLADSAVTTAKINGGAVTAAKLNADVYVPRVGSTGSGSTITANGETQDKYHVTALAVNATIAAPTGSAGDGKMLMYRIRDNGTARTLTWNAVFRAVGVDIPTETTPNKTIYVGCVRNAADSKWDVIAVGVEA